MYLAGQTIEIIHAPPAHTDGDLIVHFVEADIVQTGDTFFHGFYPDIDFEHGGTIDGMIAFYDTLYGLCGPRTRVIPGHGPRRHPRGHPSVPGDAARGARGASRGRSRAGLSEEAADRSRIRWMIWTWSGAGTSSSSRTCWRSSTRTSRRAPLEALSSGGTGARAQPPQAAG